MHNLITIGNLTRAIVPIKCHKGAPQTRHQQCRHRAVLGLLSRVQGEVVDFGCGYGDITYAISRTHSVQGVDLDAERIAFAAREYAPIRFSRCESDRLTFPDKSFDIVTSVAVIHYVLDPVQHLREIRRILRDHGHLVIMCRNVAKVRNFFRRMLGWSDVIENLWIRPESEIRALLKQEGFQVEADDYFYDPPFERWRSPRDLFIGLIQSLLSVLRVRSTSNYFLLLARKV